MKKDELKETVNAIRRQTPRSWLLVVTTGISEVLLTAALARSLCERTGYPVTLCARPELLQLVKQLYPGRFVATIGINDRLIQAFSTSTRYDGSHFDIDYPVVLDPDTYGNESIQKIHRLIYKRRGTSGLTLSDLWRYMLHLGWDDAMERPDTGFFSHPNTEFDKLGLVPGEYFFFLPGNNRSKPLPRAFWLAMDRMASEHGNVVASASGARFVDTSLSLSTGSLVSMDLLTTIYAAYHSKGLITGANGMALLMAFMEHAGNNPVMINSVISDSYFARHGRFQGTFTRCDGIHSLRDGNPEMVSASCCLSEWYLPETASEADCSGLARAIAHGDAEAPYFVKPEYRAGRARYPESRQYGERAQFVTSSGEIYF